MSRQARKMRQSLYPLKRERGEPVQIHQIDNNSADLQTGSITKTYITTRIKKAIVLPVDSIRSFVQDLAYIAANKNFTQGGLFDKQYTTVIIDKVELPSSMTITQDDYCSINGVTYKIANSNDFEKAFYILKLVTLTNFDSLEVA